MSTVNISERGAGPAVVLIHGFPFDHSVWNDFAKKLDASLRIIQVDLPGFGRSEILPNNFSITDVALELISKLNELKIKDSFLVGHSLGGYVALAMADLEPSLFSALILFHSTAKPDTDEKKENRNKVLDFVNRNGVLAFTGSFIPPLFANPNHPAVNEVRKIAVRSSQEAVLGYIKAMRDRPDRTAVLKQFHKPIFFLSGEKDPGIPVDSILEQSRLAPHISVKILTGTAHMGMFESPDETASLVNHFVLKSNRQF
jgi:pimeloyl-ACP methyl ester carboxylesterase